MNDLITLDSYCEKQKNNKCYICESNGIITEEHHINPQKNRKEHLKKRGIYKSKLVYVCPNCHSFIHKFINEKEKEIDIGYCIILSYWKEYLKKDKYINKAMEILQIMELCKYE